METPFSQDGEGHGAILGERVLTDTFQHFLAGHMLVFFPFAKDFGGHMQGITHELISERMVARIFLHRLGDGVVKGEIRHLLKIRAARGHEYFISPICRPRG
jgi:hypothetical protein